MSAEVIELPQQPRSCFDCENGAATGRGTYCVLFREQILDERRAARDCDGFEPAP